MNENLVRARQVLEKTEMPNYAKGVLKTLLEKYGVQWHIELSNFEETKGSGNSGPKIDVMQHLDNETSNQLNSTLSEFLKKIEERYGKYVPDEIEGFIDFIEGLEYIDWEEDFDDEEGFKLDVLSQWVDARIDYYRTVKELKLQDARELTYLEVESENFGGDEEGCRSCGLIFFDNLSRHKSFEAFYCSLQCQINTVGTCLQCGNEYVVGKPKKLLRMIRLSGLCSEECNNIFKDEKAVDRAYVSSMRTKAKLFDVEFDESITRREVFLRANGVCYICNKTTHFEKYEEFSPLLATVDHRIPWTKGGKHTWSNVANCCLRCNMVKKNNLLP